MTTFDASLHPRGHASNAGAFSDKVQGAPEVGLTAERKFQSTTITEGSRTPWGEADYVSEPIPGLAIVGTSSHGGVKLTAERNKLIPAALRCRNGWYEEDCDASIVGMYFPEAWPNWTREKFEDSVRDWYPDQYEAVTGNKIEPGQSHVRDQNVWATEHNTVFVAHGAGNDEPEPGFRRATATISSTGETADFLISIDELRDYESRRAHGQNNRIVIDPARHRRIDPKPEPVKVPATRYSGIAEPKTDAARRRLAADLAKRWRRSDGRIESLAEIIERGVSAKSASVENGKRSYYIHEKEFETDSSYSVLQVSKVTFDALDAPDDRPQHRIDYQDEQIARHAMEKPAYGSDRTRLIDRYREARAKADASRAAYAEAQKAQVNA